MAQSKNTLQEIESTIKAVENITQVLKTAKEQLAKLENEKKEIEKEKVKLETEKTQLENDKEKLEEETQTLEKEKQERDQKIGSMTEEQERLLKEYDSLKVELKKLAKIAEEAEGAEFNFERIKALLSIYAVLINEIWQGQPHYRILLTLHGDKVEMSREELKNTTGIGGAFILRAVHELANIDLVEYNEDTGMVKLKRRLFEKKALEEKEGKPKK